MQVEEGGEQEVRSKAFPKKQPHPPTPHPRRTFREKRRDRKSQFHKGGAEARSDSRMKQASLHLNMIRRKVKARSLRTALDRESPVQKAVHHIRKKKGRSLGERP